MTTPITKTLARLMAGLLVCGVSTGAFAQSSPLLKACEQIGGRLKSVGVKTCLESGFAVSNGTSVKGIPLLVRDYTPASPPKSTVPKRVMMIGGIHGDELTSVSVAFQWMQKLERERLQPFQWRVIPCANPDGLTAKPSSRVNSRGVDLNRNFPSAHWDTEALKYWKEKARSDPRRYPGPAALSEPETRWLDEQIRQFKPDAIVSVHAPYGVLDYDGPRDPPKQFGYLRLQLLGTYPGSLGNYAGSTLKVPVITLELPSAGIMPNAMQAQRIWGDMLKWLETNLSKPVRADSAPVRKEMATNG